VNFSIYLIDQLVEQSRQFQFHPKAMHPQMESVFGRKDYEGTSDEDEDSDATVFSIASCGFTGLAEMERLPDDLADAVQYHKRGLCANCVLNISTEIMEDFNVDDPSTVRLDQKTVSELHIFLGIYANSVYGIKTPLAVNINPDPVHSTEYDGVRWFTYAFQYVVGIEVEEWDKLYELKVQEITWATHLKRKETAEAQAQANELFNKFKH
jgi:hypothetical protein